MLENKDKNLTKLEDFGEFNLIDFLTKDIKIRHDSTVKSIGNSNRNGDMFSYSIHSIDI